MNNKGKPKCIVMLSNNSILFQICEYSLDTAFAPLEPFVLNLNQILGLNTARPKVTKQRTKTVPVAIVENKPKSPVGRGMVGGALLGPAGIVLGAASGLNSKTSTTIENQKVIEEYETEGDTQLIIGTSVPERPVLKLRFSPPSLADEWLYRLQGAQQRRS